jgi:hypothetical protein
MDGPVRERTGPPPLLLLDRDLDLSVEDHHDQQQEEKMRYHLFLRLGWPAGVFPPVFPFSGPGVNVALSARPQFPGHILNALPRHASGPGTSRHRPLHRLRP